MEKSSSIGWFYISLTFLVGSFMLWWIVREFILCLLRIAEENKADKERRRAMQKTVDLLAMQNQTRGTKQQTNHEENSKTTHQHLEG